jgi:hypothetical protein
MRGYRSTTRRLMAAVAVISIVMGTIIEGSRWKGRWDFCMRAASLHAHLEHVVGPYCRGGCPHSFVAIPATAYHTHLRRKYEYVAWRPWLPVPIDSLKSRWDKGEVDLNGGTQTGKLDESP